LKSPTDPVFQAARLAIRPAAAQWPAGPPVDSDEIGLIGAKNTPGNDQAGLAKCILLDET
jgi:hypothetical protein